LNQRNVDYRGSL